LNTSYFCVDFLFYLFCLQRDQIDTKRGQRSEDAKIWSKVKSRGQDGVEGPNPPLRYIFFYL
jgi:hypothetical protein